jgi:hypothetical protein
MLEGIRLAQDQGVRYHDERNLGYGAPGTDAEMA